jgi:hypothetical protein
MLKQWKQGCVRMLYLFILKVKTLDEFNIMIRKPAISILESIKSDESAARKFVICILKNTLKMKH